MPIKKFSFFVCIVLASLFHCWPKLLLCADDGDKITYYQYLCGLEVTTRGGAPYDPVTAPPMVGKFDAVPYTPKLAYSEQLNHDLKLMLQGQMKDDHGEIDNTPLLKNIRQAASQALGPTKVGQSWDALHDKMREMLKPVEAEVAKAVCQGARWDNFIFYAPQDFPSLGNGIFNYDQPFMSQTIFQCGKTKVDICFSSKELTDYAPRLGSQMHAVFSDGQIKEDFFVFNADPLVYADCYILGDNSWLKISTSSASWNYMNEEMWENRLAVNHYFFNGKYVGTKDSFSDYWKLRYSELPENAGWDLDIPNLIWLKGDLRPFENTGLNASQYVTETAPCPRDQGVFSPDTSFFRKELALAPVPQRPFAD